MAKKASRIPNPLALNMYVLGYDSKKKLTNVNQAVKENLQTYLGQYRMVTDAINIKNAYVINIGVKFSLMTRPNFNKNEVLLRAIEPLPIIITNKYKTANGYSGNLYDIDTATKNGIIYPSLDPSIFELKYPGIDIEGRVVGDN